MTFENTSGFDVTIKTILTKDGAAEVPVPPIANLSTGDFISSKVTVSIPSGGQATLNVLPLPELSGVAPGDVAKMYLSYTKSKLETSLDNMDEFSLEFDYDTSELEQQIQIQIDTIEASISEIETSSQMSIYSYYDGKIVLDQDDLGKLDQLLFAVLKGAMDEDLKLAAEESVVSASVNMLSDDTSDIEELTNWVKSDIANSKVLFVGAGSMIVTVSGALIGEAAAGMTLLYAFQAGTVTVLVVGVATEGIGAVQAAFDPNKEYEFGDAITKEIEEAVLNMAVAAGTEENGVINLISFLMTTSDVTTALSNQICNLDPIPYAFKDYCKEWEYQPKELDIQFFRFTNKVTAPGVVEGGLYFLLQGDRDGDKVSVKIDWGDGSVPEIETLTPHHTYNCSANDINGHIKYPYLNHIYTLGEEETDIRFIISIHAIDENGNEAWSSTAVEVTKNLEPTVAFSSIPSRIKTGTNKPRAWGITVTGARDPFTYKMSWGDEGDKIEYGTRNFSGPFTLNHEYTSKGIYPVSIEVTDAYKISVSATSQADVRDPVSITSITGPTSLDVKDPGTWTVNLDGGWGPYKGTVYWEDFTDNDFSSQTRQFNISHAYAEKGDGTFTFEVDVTDDEGDTATKGFTVKVPKTDPVIPITWTITCNDPNVPSQTINTTLTVNEDYSTVTLNIDVPDKNLTTTLTGNNFIFTWITTLSDGDVWTEIFKGSIHINETTARYNRKRDLPCIGDV